MKPRGIDGRGNNKGDRLGLRFFVFMKLLNTLLVPDLPILISHSLRTINIIRIHLLVLFLLLFRQLLPVPPLVGGKGLPLLADRLGEIGLSLFLVNSGGSGGLSFFDTFPPEEDEGVFRTFDVIFVTFFGAALSVAR